VARGAERSGAKRRGAERPATTSDHVDDRRDAERTPTDRTTLSTSRRNARHARSARDAKRASSRPRSCASASDRACDLGYDLSISVSLSLPLSLSPSLSLSLSLSFSLSHSRYRRGAPEVPAVRERDIAAISRHPSRCSDAVARDRCFVHARYTVTPSRHVVTLH